MKPIRSSDDDAAQLARELQHLATMTGRLDRTARAELRQVIRRMRQRCGDVPRFSPTDMLQ